METLMTRRELLLTFGIATLVNCRRTERPEPERTQGPDSIVTLTVDGMI